MGISVCSPPMASGRRGGWWLAGWGGFKAGWRNSCTEYGFQLVTYRSQGF